MSQEQVVIVVVCRFSDFYWRASNLLFLISGDRDRVVSTQSVVKTVHFRLHLLQGVVEIGVARITVDFRDFAVRGLFICTA